MKYCVGIDLGSTTTKAVVLDEEGNVLGQGITNSRSNYEVACEVALGEALIRARFGMMEARLGDLDSETRAELLGELERLFRAEQYSEQLAMFGKVVRRLADENKADPQISEALTAITSSMQDEVGDLFAPGASRKSDFFRDLAGSRFLKEAEGIARRGEVSFDGLVGLFDKAILEAENCPPSAAFEDHARSALTTMTKPPAELEAAVEYISKLPLEQAVSVGTGYGRATLPFEKDCIRSEILCHGLGAHAMFPGTRTVLDIGGQDTKAIQVDDRGIVTSFQMNDRCAAGCGRYLGYIADEMNLGLHELGPMACSAKRTVKINSTCTVFAGAELRERLSLGEKREDILAGLHRAIVLRAMSLLARSGGVHDEFTFTGGVAKNPAAVGALEKLIGENYGERTINISPDSIYTGALGAALFAWRDWTARMSAADEPALAERNN